MDFKFNENNVGKTLFILGFISLIVATYMALSKIGIWYDENFSIMIVTAPDSVFWQWIIHDVHPPFYYIIFEFFYIISCSLGYNEPIFIGKVVSLIPFYFLAILTLTKIRKDFGMLTAGFFFLAICTMAPLPNYAIEIRMYSWALFFVTTCFIYAYDLIKEPTIKKWVIITVLAICSAYTHYFAAVAAFMIYAVLLFFIIRSHRKLLKGWIVSAVICVLSYIPWLFIVNMQFQRNVMGKFWVKPISVVSVVNNIYLVLSPIDVQVFSFDALFLPTIFVFVFGIMLLYLLFKIRDDVVYSAMAVSIGVPLIGHIISLLTQPIWFRRYLIPILGCFWLGFSILCSKTFKIKKLFIPILAIFLITSAVGMGVFVNDEIVEDADSTDQMRVLNETIGIDNIVLYDTSYNYVSISPISRNHHVPIEYNSSTLLWRTGDVKDLERTLNQSDIQNEIKEGRRVFLIADILSDDDLQKSNLTVVLIDKDSQRHFDFNQFRVYEIIP